MRRNAMVAALGLLAGAATLVGGQDDEDWELATRIERLQAVMAQLRAQSARGRVDRLPAVGVMGEEFEPLAVYDLTSGRSDARPPRFDAEEGGESPYGGWSDEARQPLGTIEEILELVRCSVSPEAWEQGGSLNCAGQTLLAVQTPALLQDVRAFLEKQRDRAHRCVSVEAMAVDLPDDTCRALGAGERTALTTEQQRVLEEALKAGTAQGVFSARVTGFVGQNVVLWRGSEVARLRDPRVMIAKGMAVSDPVVDALLTGGVLSVRPSLSDSGDRVTLDLDVRYTELEGLTTVEAAAAGPVDVPRTRDVAARTAVTVPHRAWALLGGGARVGDRTRVLLVRATVLPRKGGVR